MNDDGWLTIDFGDDRMSLKHLNLMLGEHGKLGPGYEKESDEPGENTFRFARVLGEPLVEGPVRSARDMRLWHYPVTAQGMRGWEPEYVKHLLAQTEPPGGMDLPTLRTPIADPALKRWKPRVLVAGEPAGRARIKRRSWGWQVRLPKPPAYSFDGEEEHDLEAIERGCWMAKFARYKIERQALKRLLSRVRLARGEMLVLFCPSRANEDG